VPGARQNGVVKARRETVQRRAIRDVFRLRDGPIGVEEILRLARRAVRSLNRVTVYRNLNLLVAEGGLLRIRHPALGTVYEKAGKDHHHHFHCRSCDRLFEIPGCALRKAGVAPRGFRAEEHDLFVSGLCAACRVTPRAAGS
jgi:Fur family ferric uptake transcriptional regulator